MLLERLEKSGLARSCLSGEKDADAGVLGKFPCVAQLFIFHIVCYNRFVLTNLMEISETAKECAVFFANRTYRTKVFISTDL